MKERLNVYSNVLAMRLEKNAGKLADYCDFISIASMAGAAACGENIAQRMLPMGIAGIYALEADDEQTGNKRFSDFSKNILDLEISYSVIIGTTSLATAIGETLRGNPEKIPLLCSQAVGYYSHAIGRVLHRIANRSISQNNREF
jgi:hypothetical protein